MPHQASSLSSPLGLQAVPVPLPGSDSSRRWIWGVKSSHPGLAPADP